MIRITEHTRTARAAPADCSECGGPIVAGNVYRQLIAVQSEAFDRAYVRQIAHRGCAAGWTLTTPETIRADAEASLSYIRKRYGDKYPLGARCTADGEPGRIEGGDGGYLLVRVDGRKHADRYHPLDVEVTP